MSTQPEIEDSERRLLMGICSLSQTLQYEPVPFHRVLPIHEVRNFFDTGMMPMDEPEDVGDREPGYDASTWIKGGDGPPGDYVARLEISGKTRIYDPSECIFLVVGMQVEFTKYKTGRARS